jgi:hypothetical protein
MVKRRGNFVGWTCARVAWRWNAAGVFQYRLRFSGTHYDRDLAGVRARSGLSWACGASANDVHGWGWR